MSATPLVFTLRNDLEALGAVSEQVESALAPLHLTAREAYAIRLVLDESLSNTINYGYSDSSVHEIRLELLIDDEAVTITITDDAMLFNPLAAAAPSIGGDLDDRPIGGLGIHLTRTVMDECTYSVENGRNRLVMRKKKNLGGSPTAP